MRSEFVPKVLLTATLAAASADASATTIAYASQLDFGNIDYLRTKQAKLGHLLSRLPG